MPIYGYKCGQGHKFEVMQRMSDDPVSVCETCDAPVERVFHPVAVHFKGSGFYNTDYGTRKRSRELKDSAEGTGKNGDSSSKSDSSDSKPAKSESTSSSTSSSTSESTSSSTSSSSTSD